MFASLPSDLKLGQFQQPPAPVTRLAVLEDGNGAVAGFIKDGVEYR
jgi:hypothetical protein